MSERDPAEPVPEGSVPAEPVLAVVGAINVDLVVTGAPLPSPGETVTGGTFAEHQGGKGGNQATAAARAFGGAGRVVMIGAVGDDDLGAAAVAALEDDGIDTTSVARTSFPTGVALITVAPGGENQISVAPGANAAIEATQVEEALAAARPHVVLMSLEVPVAAARAAAAWCTSHAVRLLLNPAPIQPWARGLLDAATWITPNEHELAALGGPAAATSATVVETRGPAGAVIHGDPPIVVGAPAVDAVDSTGAGDCFNGVLAAALAEGTGLEQAVRLAVGAAAISVTIAGARDGMPTRERIAEVGADG